MFFYKMPTIYKYIVFVIGCIGAYFEPVQALLLLVITLFVFDFFTGIAKSRKTSGRWMLQSKKLRWSFVKMFVYLAIMALTFNVCEATRLSDAVALSVVKVEVWCIVYVEGLSIIENLLVVFPEDKFLRFMHYWFSVEFLRYFPLISGFFKEREK
jgi:phage-related holin